MRQKTSTLALFALLDAALMLVLTLYWLSLPRTFGDELLFIKWTSIVKKSLLGLDERPQANEVLYVDVAGSKQVLDIPDPLYAEPTGFHRAVVTDREQLRLFLDKVATYGHDIPLVLLDLSFEHSSPADSALQATVDRFPFPILAAQRLDDQGNLTPSAITLPMGVANYLGRDQMLLAEFEAPGVVPRQEFADDMRFHIEACQAPNVEVFLDGLLFSGYIYETYGRVYQPVAALVSLGLPEE